MGSKEILTLMADENDQLNLGDAVEAVADAIRALVAEGIVMDGQTALQLFSNQLDFVSMSLAKLVVSTQVAVTAAHRGLDQLITGQESAIEEMDGDLELSQLMASFQLQSLARTLDALEAVKKAKADAAADKVADLLELVDIDDTVESVDIEEDV